MQISLSKRDLSDFDASAFSTHDEKEMLASIARLDLSQNFLSHVRGVQCLAHLTDLDVSHNRISTLALLPLRLRRLNASYNNLTTLDGLGPLSQLEHCDVSYNELTTVNPPGGLPATMAMRHLDLSHNRLATLQGLENVPGLHALFLDHNLLRQPAEEEESTTVFEPLRSLKSLRTITLADNPIALKAMPMKVLNTILPRTTTLDGHPVTGPSGGNQSSSSFIAVEDDTQRSHQQETTTTATNISAIRPDSGGQRPSSATTRARQPLPQQRLGDPRPINPNDVSASSAVPHRAADGSNTSFNSRSTTPPVKRRTSSPATRRSLSGGGVGPAVDGTGHVLTSPRRPSSVTSSISPSRRSISPGGDQLLTSPKRPSSHGASPRSPIDVRRHPKPSTAPGPASVVAPDHFLGSRTAGNTSKTQQVQQRQQAQRRSSTSIGVPIVESQRLMEARIAELEGQVSEYKARLKKSQADNDTVRMQLTQLRETVARQGKVNAMLADTNRDLNSTNGPVKTAATPHVGWQRDDRPRSQQSQQQRVSPKRPSSTAATSGGSRRSSSPSGSTSRRPSSPSNPAQQAPRGLVKTPMSGGQSRHDVSSTSVGSNRPSSGGSSRQPAPRPASPTSHQELMGRPTRSSAIAAQQYMRQKQGGGHNASMTSDHSRTHNTSSGGYAAQNRRSSSPSSRVAAPHGPSTEASVYMKLLQAGGGPAAASHHPRPSSAGKRTGSSSSATTAAATAAATVGGSRGRPSTSHTPMSNVSIGSGSRTSSGRRPASADARLKAILADLGSPSRNSPNRALSTSASSSARRNVSFGGSQFYSPPHNY